MPDRREAGDIVAKRGRKSGEQRGVEVVASLRHLHDLDWLDECSLARHQAVKKVVNPTCLMAEGQALRKLFLWAVEQTISDTMASPRFNMLMVVSFASLALVLAAVGIYGVMAHTVAQRNREMGVRLALGASHGAILRQVLHDGFRMAATGIGLGVAGALVLTRLLESLLYGVSPTDPFTFSAVIVTIAVVATIACYIPARRAMRVDPLEALKAE